MLSKEDAKFLAETYREFIIFYAVLFFTCVVGIIELLPQVEKWTFDFGLRFWTFDLPLCLLYFLGFLLGIIISIHECFDIYRKSAKLTRSGQLGYGVKEYVKEHPTIIDHFILTKKGTIIEVVLIIGVLSIFTLLYFSKICLL